MGDFNEENVPFLNLNDFLEKVSEINEKIASYKNNLEEIDTLQNKLVRGHLPWNQDARKQLSEDLEFVVGRNKAIEKDIRIKIKECMEHKLSNENENIKQEKVKSMAKLMADAVQMYKNIDIQYKEKLKKKLITAIKISEVSLSEEDIENKIDKNEIDEFITSSIIKETEDAKKQLGEVKDRHEELMRFEKSILELTELFNEMIGIVQGQGITINKIEQKIIVTETSVEHGVGALKLSGQLYEKVMSKKKILALFGAFILILLILIVSLSNSNNDQAPNVIGTTTTPTITTTTTTTTVCNPDFEDGCVG